MNIKLCERCGNTGTYTVMDKSGDDYEEVFCSCEVGQDAEHIAMNEVSSKFGPWGAVDTQMETILNGIRL